MRVQRRILIGLGFLVFLILMFLCFKARPLIPSPYTLSDSIRSDRDICVTSVSYEGNDVSDQLDDAALVEILSRYSCRLSPLTSSERSLEGAWEINLIRYRQPFHIVVGDSVYCYSDAVFRYAILDPDALRQEIDLLVTPVN